MEIDPRLHVAGNAYSDGATARVVDPWTGERLADVVLADARRAEEATVAAGRAFAASQQLTSAQRRDLLRHVAASIAAHAGALSDLIARDAGKPVALARGEVARAVQTFELGAEEATRLGGETMRLDTMPHTAGFLGAWLRVPVGPVLAMAPFNFPLNLVAHKVSPALAVGAPVVLKPPPQAPLASLALGAFVREAARVVAAPEDLLQVLPCEIPVAEALARDERYAVLSFTGSARVGWHLKSIAGRKRVLLELGGNGAVVVHEDAPDLAYAARRVAEAAFAYAGQVCVKAQRLYVHAPVYERVVADVVARAQALVPRSPLEEGAIVGPLVDEASARRVESWVAAAKDEGARVLCGGLRDGAKLPPHVVEVDGSGHGLQIVDEEVFGPVLTVHRYRDFDEALALADDTRYGLSAAVFTDSQARVQRAFARLHVGGLVINDAPTFRVDGMPFGGMRESGYGREGVRFAVEDMTERKLLVLAGALPR